MVPNRNTAIDFMLLVVDSLLHQCIRVNTLSEDTVVLLGELRSISLVSDFFRASPVYTINPCS